MVIDGPHAVVLGDNLSRSQDKQAGLRWPTAVDEVLDRLVRQAQAAGERVYRREILAALVSTCDLDGPALGEMLRRYRTMTVAQALKDEGAPDDVVRLPGKKPGPRAH